MQLPQQFFFLFFPAVLFKHIIQLINDSDRITARLAVYALPSSRWSLFYCLSLYFLLSFFILFYCVLFLCFVFYLCFFHATVFLNSHFLFLSFCLFPSLFYIFSHFAFLRFILRSFQLCSSLLFSLLPPFLLPLFLVFCPFYYLVSLIPVSVTFPLFSSSLSSFIYPPTLFIMQIFLYFPDVFCKAQALKCTCSV